MDKTIDGRALIQGADLLRSAALVDARFRDRSNEVNRLAAVRNFLNAAFRLERALKVQTRCALVNHSGTPGTHNLEDATQLLFNALSDYAVAVRELSSIRLENESIPWPTAETREANAMAARLRAV